MTFSPPINVIPGFFPSLNIHEILIVVTVFHLPKSSQCQYEMG